MIVAIVASLFAASSCAGSDGQSVDPLGRLIARQEPIFPRANGTDTWEVVVCRVPVGITDPMYAPINDRMSDDASAIVDSLAPVSDYFDRWSGNRYDVRFVAAESEVSILTTETSEQCVERALAASSPDAEGVLVVADAQHDVDQEGGRGTPGTECVAECSAKVTGRAVYVGAADFMGDREAGVPLDLVEHELGHALDWPHSGMSIGSLESGSYDSPYDLMSNSAASWQSNPSLRDGPGILVVNLLSVGWITREQVDVWSPRDRQRSVNVVSRSSSNAEDPKMIVVPVDENSFFTLEFVSADGDDSFHTDDFVIAHRIEIRGGSGFDRRQFVVSPELRPGDAWTTDDFEIRIESIDGTNATLTLTAR